jgi:signal transduction histidine kinase
VQPSSSMEKVTQPSRHAGVFVWLPYVVGGTTIVLTLTGMTLGMLNADASATTTAVGATSTAVGLAAVALAYSVSGTVLTSRRPDNAIGWLMLAIGLSEAILVASTGYAFLALAHRSIPGGVVAAWMGGWTYLPPLGVLLTFLLLLYPTGQPPTPRWRWVGWVAAAGLSVAVIGSAIALWDQRFAMLADPNADVSPQGTLGAIALMGSVVAFGVAGIASIVSLVVRWRRSEGDERQQLRWFLLAVAVAAVGFADGWIDTRYIVLVTGMLLIPAAIAIAVLKYRLYDLDIVIRKTAIYAVLAALLLAVFATITWTATQVFSTAVGDRFRLVAGILVGALIWPLRSVATRIADRLVYGGRATPYEVLSGFADQIGTMYADDDVTSRMATLLREATGATAAHVWLAGAGGFHLVASAPMGATAATWPAEGVAVHYQGELLGGLSVTMPANDRIDAARERLVRDLAGQAGPVLANVRLIADLRASRRRIVATQDDRAKKLERDIHDGAQQQLVALSVKLRLAEQTVDRDPAKARELLVGLGDDANDALENLRDLARGIYPPLLADKGLAAALEAQARKAAVPTTVDPGGVGRFPQEVESAVYFSCLEALQNVAKYAEATQAEIALTNGEGSLRFTVTDDGKGFDASATSYGTGLQGIADRLAAIGGELVVTSTPGTGTTIAGRLPATPLETGT